MKQVGWGTWLHATMHMHQYFSLNALGDFRLHISFRIRCARQAYRSCQWKGEAGNLSKPRLGEHLSSPPRLLKESKKKSCWSSKFCLSFSHVSFSLTDSTVDFFILYHMTDLIFSISGQVLQTSSLFCCQRYGLFDISAECLNSES